MCHKPSRDEVAAGDAERRIAEEMSSRGGARPTDATSRLGDQREDPATNPGPRGNQEADESDVERSAEKLSLVLGH